MRINSNGTVHTNSAGQTFGVFFNSKKTPGWNNAFNVTSSNFTSNSFVQNYGGVNLNGNVNLQKPENKHTVVAQEVGKSLSETAKTNVSAGIQSTPGQVSFTNNNGQNLGTVDIATEKRSVATVKVPYNFINTTEVLKSTDDSKNYLYAGEKDSVGFSITIHPRQNNITNGNYATRVDDAQYKLHISYQRDGSGPMEHVYTEPVKTTLNKEGSITETNCNRVKVSLFTSTSQTSQQALISA